MGKKVGRKSQIIFWAGWKISDEAVLITDIEKFISFPGSRIVGNVFTDTVIVRFISDNMVMKTGLPNWYFWRVSMFIDAFGN